VNTYDAENRLSTSTLGGVTTAYTYDGDGRRVQKATGSSTTTYVYDAEGQLAAEYGALTTPPPCATCYLTADNLGSTRMVTDSNGTVQSLTDYLPFGEEIQSGVGGRPAPYYPSDALAVADGVTQKFTGKERDVETGNDHFGARYFSGPQGRWTSPDRINVTNARLVSPSNTLNKYAYAASSPLKFVDRDGEDFEVFYRPSDGILAPLTGNYGHIFLGVVNQATGDANFLDFYPAGPLSGTAGPGELNRGGMQDRFSQLPLYASLTVQTTPEAAQEMLNLIAVMKAFPTQLLRYDALSVNCTTLTEDVLTDLGLNFGDILPDTFFRDLFERYGHASGGSYDNLVPDRVLSLAHPAL
jgi:RHS repeat-associated protein